MQILKVGCGGAVEEVENGRWRWLAVVIVNFRV
jgi:hypothetical protein